MYKIVLLYALFASTFSLGKVLLNYVSPIYLVGIRMSIAGIVLLTYQYLNKKKTFKLHRSNWKMYVQVILFTCYLPYIFRFWGLAAMPAAKASLLYTFSPFLTYLFSHLICHETIRPQKIIGLLIGFVSMLPVLIAPAPLEDIVGGVGFFSWAECYILLSVSCLSYGWIVMRKLLTEHEYEPGMINGLSMFIGGIMALITSMLVETKSCVTNVYEFLGILAIVILVSNLLCHNIYSTLLKQYSPTLLAFAGFLTPLFAALYSWVFTGEQMSWTFYISVIGVAIGLTIFYYDEFNGQRQASPTIKEPEINSPVD